MSSEFLDKDSKRTQIHAFVQVGSYSIAKKKFNTHFRILYNQDPDEIKKVISECIDKYIESKKA